MPQSPSWIFADSTPGQDMATNEAMPRFGGKVNPGETVRVSVDGETTTISPTPNGTWEWASPELADGAHDFEMWTEDADGNESDHVEWENDIQADAQTREWQRARNRQWNEQGAREFLDQNDHPTGTPPRPITGGGGQQSVPDPQPTGPTQERPQTGGSSGGSGALTAGGSPSPQGLEKGNAIRVG
ncbi:MAG: Ig-like domain-containing protein [Dehalococcoidia bacterium]|nr:Ig-like domain-containing protein [Dehalococcoidia bacterium]